jgi:hypothetical protein
MIARNVARSAGWLISSPLAHRDSSTGLISVAGRDNPLGIGYDRIIEKDVHVVLGRQ